MRLDRMKKARKDAGLTQQQVGDRMGCAQTRITMIENGASVKPETAERVAAAIGCGIEDLIEPREPLLTLKLSELSSEQIAALTKK